MALRPRHLGRAVAALLALLLVLAPGVARAGGRVFLISVDDGLREPAERAKLTPLLGALGYRQVSWIDLADLESRLGLVAITDLRPEDACGGTVALEAWTERLDAAQEAVQLLAVDRALAELTALNLDVACLGAVPRQAELVLLGLVTAEAHAVAMASGSDIGIRMFHQEEARHALAVAASFGPDLPPPAWLAPPLREELLALQAASGPENSAPVYFGGTARGLWLDGKRITTGFRRLEPGQHLVQATWGDDVVAARLIAVVPGRHTLVRVTPGEAAVESEDLIIALQRLAAGAEPDPLVADLLGLLAEEADDALVVGLSDEGPLLWGRGRGGVVLRYPGGDLAPAEVRFEDVGDEPAPPRPPRPPALPFTVGFGPSVLWTNLGDGPLEGLGGVHGGLGVQGRITVARPLAVAVALHPVAKAEALPPGYDARWLWRAMIPVRAGLRVGVPRPVPHLEAGLDGALWYLGQFQRSQELRGLGIGSVGLYLPLSSTFGLRLEAWGGLGAGFGAAGLQIAGVGHPAPPVED